MAKKVLIADDHSLFSAGLSSLIEKEPNLKVVGHVDNGTDVLYQVISFTPDVLILDLNLPGKNGLEVLKEVKDFDETLKIHIVTMYSDGHLVEEVKKRGGDGYFLKNSDEQEIINAINSNQNGFYLSQSINEQDNSVNHLVEDDFSTVVKLTSREKEILKLIVEGLSSKDIASELNISPATVDTHRKNMLKKLDFNKVSELVSYAYRNKLV